MSKKCIVRILPLLILGTALAAQQIQVRVNDNLSSATTQAGATFDGTLVSSASLNGRSCAKGSTVNGRVTEAKPSGRLSDPGILQLELTSIQCSGRNYTITADPVRLEGKSHTKRNATLIGGGAAAGAILGGLLGGGKGAAVGAGVGAGAGTAGAAAGGKKEAEIESEAIVGWNVTSVTEDRASHRYRDHDRDSDRRDDYRRDRDADNDYTMFSERQRNMVRECMNSGRSGLPPGLAKKNDLPPGLEKQIQRNGTLPPGLEKKVRQLPYACTDELPNIPGGWERVILSGRILLLDRDHRIVDMFFLAD